MSLKYLWRTAAIFALGCSSTPIDVGSYVPDDEVRWNTWTDERSCAGGPQLPIVGTWTGYTDMPTLTAQSSNVRLSITHANGRLICGTLTLGNEAPPWPPVTDPGVAYPPELSNNRQESFGSYLSLLQGVPMTITNSRVGLPRVSFRASYAQWKDWCAMQTPYKCEDIATEEYYCIPVSGSGGLSPRVLFDPKTGVCMTTHSGESTVIDCGKAALCLGGPCTCTSAACVAPPIWGQDFQIDFHDDSAEGSGMHLTRSR